MKAKQPKTPKPKTPMTQLEKQAAWALGHCRFAPATWSKRFARDMSERAALDVSCEERGKDPEGITDKQRAALWRLVWTFRKQVERIGGRELVKAAIEQGAKLACEERSSNRLRPGRGSAAARGSRSRFRSRKRKS